MMESKKTDDIEFIKIEKSDNKFTRNYAKAVLLGIKIREESFDKKEADRRERKDKYPYFTDLYRIREDDAMEQGFLQMKLDKSLAYPAYLALHWYNDLQWWCCKVLGWDEKEWFDNKFDIE